MRDLRGRSESRRSGPPGLCYVRDSGALRGPSVPSFEPRPLHPEEALPRARVRRRRTACLGAHPRRDAPGGRRLHVAALARAARRAAASRTTRWSSRRRPRAAPGSRPASRACSPRAPRRSSGRGTCVKIVAPGTHAPAPARRACLHRRRAEPAVHVRPVRDRRRQPARPRRRAGRGRDARARLQPALHLRAARARQDPPPALDRQLPGRARRRADRPLHDGRGVHRPLRRRAPHRRARGRSRRPTAASTSCSSTTSSSSRARPAPSRSSSTPSTRSTAPAPSSSSPPTACRAISTRSRTACASASRPAW